MSAPRIYNADILTNILTKIAGFYKGLTDLIEEHFPEMEDTDAYVYSMEIVLQHRDDWTIGRIGLDDFLFFELTDEDYGKTRSEATS